MKATLERRFFFAIKPVGAFDSFYRSIFIIKTLCERYEYINIMYCDVAIRICKRRIGLSPLDFSTNFERKRTKNIKLDYYTCRVLQ